MTADQESLKTAYLEQKQQTLKNIIFRLTHSEIEEKIGDNHSAKEILVYLYCYHWLRFNVAPAYYRETLSLANNQTYSFLVDLLCRCGDEKRFLKEYIAYCANPINLYHGPHNAKAKALYERCNLDLDKTVDYILSLWDSLGYFKQERQVFISAETKRQKAVFDSIDSETDRQRLSLIDRLSLNHTKIAQPPVRLQKVAIVPTFKCKYRCRHCMFLWRPRFNKTIDIATLFPMVNEIAMNVLFTGGDLTNYMDDFCYGIETMDRIETFAIMLNGAFASSLDVAKQKLTQIQNALLRRKSCFATKPSILLQISFDEFHQTVHIDQEGRFYEKLPIHYIANLLETSLNYRMLDVVLLHKQHAYNFSTDILNKGVVARLFQELNKRKIRVNILQIEQSPRLKTHPATKAQTDRMAINIRFSLAKGKEKNFLINSSLVDSMGEASLLHPSEYVDGRDVKDKVASQRLKGERMEGDLMFWYNGNTTYFPIPHILLGNLLEDDMSTIMSRYLNDPLIAYAREFDTKLLDYYQEIMSDYDELYRNASSHLQLYNGITRFDKVRFELTNRILAVDKTVKATVS